MRTLRAALAAASSKKDAFSSMLPTKFNDTVYGDLCAELPKLCMKVVDTPEFQRQRSLSQLGSGRHVYHAAVHSRLEHAIGVGHLAQHTGRILQGLRDENSACQEVSESNIRVLTVAGLCQNLGHGPYGEAFEIAYERLTGLNPDDRQQRIRRRSAAIFGRICAAIEDAAEETVGAFLSHEEQRTVKSILAGDGQLQESPLYRLIYGDGTGVDLDSMDSMRRDALYCDVKPSIDFLRMLKTMQILRDENDPGKWHLCWKKEQDTVRQYFQKRQAMQREVYKSPKVVAATQMIADILELAADGLDLKRKLLGLERAEGAPFEGCCLDGFLSLDDYILCQVEELPDHGEKNAKAKELLKRLTSGDLYQLVATATFKAAPPPLAGMEEHLAARAPWFTSNDHVLLKAVNNAWTDTATDPMGALYWYSEARAQSTSCSTSNQSCSLQPREWCEHQVYVYLKPSASDEEAGSRFRRKELQDAFRSWCEGLNSGAAAEAAGQRQQELCCTFRRVAAPSRSLVEFKDHIYKRISFDREAYAAVICHPYFQRMRYIGQLGAVPYVFYGGAHTRFEHSLGVGHLAHQAVVHLRETGTKPNITDEDVFVVTLAGLCHDLGHGPMSHAFEAVARDVSGNPNWTHEDMSCSIFQKICEDVRPRVSLEVEKRVVNFIRGNRASELGKGFLVDLISNSRNGIDVDKLDYLARDAKYTNYTLGESFHPFHKDLIHGKGQPDSQSKCMRVVGSNLSWHIEDRHNIANMYIERAGMHDNVYLHKQVKAVELMLMEAVVKASAALGIAEKLRDPRKYVMLRDSIVNQIEHWSGPEDCGMREAQRLVCRIRMRKIYKCVSICPLPAPRRFGSGAGDIQVSEEDVIKEMEMERDASGGHQAAARLGPGDIIVWKKTLDCTKFNDRPLQHVDFYEEADGGDGNGVALSGRDASLAFRATSVTNLEAAKMFSEHPWKHQAVVFLKQEDPADTLVEEVDTAFKTCMAKKLGLKDATEVTAITPSKSIARKRMRAPLEDAENGGGGKRQLFSPH